MFENMQKKFQNLNKQIDDLWEKIEDAGEETKDKFEDALETLQKKREQAKKKMEKPQKSDSGTWGHIKSGFDASLDELEEAYHKTASFFHHKKQGYEISYIDFYLKRYEQKIHDLRQRIPEELGDFPAEQIHEEIERIETTHQTAQSKFSQWDVTEETEQKDRLKAELDDLVDEIEAKYENVLEYFPVKHLEYRQKIEKTLEELEAKIAELEEITQQRGTAIQKDAQQTLDTLRQKHERIRAQSEEFKASNAKAWEHFKTGMDSAVGDLKNAYQKAHEEYK